MGIKKLSIKSAMIATACVMTLSCIIYFANLSNREFEKTVVLQTQRELLTIAKVAAEKLDEFITYYQEALQIVSNDPSIKERIYNKVQWKKEEYGEKFCQVENLYRAHNKHVDALTIVDANGKMLDRDPFWKDNKSRMGWDYSDKPGVACVLREHKPCVSEAFHNYFGNLAISILEPVFYKDKFAGIVRWMIETDTISRKFIESIKIGSKGFVWMFDKNDTVISHPRKDFIGITVLDAVKKSHKERGEAFDESRIQEHIGEEHDYLNRVKVEEEGFGIFINCVTDEHDIIAYNRVAAGGLILNLVVTLPYSEITGPINKHAREIFGLAGFFIMLLGAGGFVFFKSQREKAGLEAEAKYLKQISNGAEALAAEMERRMEFAKQLEEANRQLKRLTLIDGLTGIANRRYFDEFLEKEWQRNMRDNKPVCLIMGDIDFFKNYNDTYGHPAGDDCLEQIAAILNNIAKRPGDLAARYGGEEFAVILSGTDLKQARVLAEKARKQLSNIRIPHSDSQVADYVTLSLGVASIIPKYGTNSSDLIKAADKALYKAKNCGRNQVILYLV